MPAEIIALPVSIAENRKARRPFVLINMAMTADGKIATANRAVTSFGSSQDLRHLYELRASADAIICGARTIEQSQATLGNGGETFRKSRLRARRSEYPIRILVSGSGTISPAAELWSHRFSPIIVLTTEKARPRLPKLAALADQVWTCGAREIDFAAALGRLRSDFGIKRLLGEGGGELNDALIRAGLLDELHLTVCPRIFGGRTAPTLAEGIGFEQLANAARFVLKSRRRVGDEVFLVFSSLSHAKTGRRSAPVTGGKPRPEE